MPDAVARDFILETVVKHLREEDFAFSLEIPQIGPPWDVYRFTRQGKRGMIALRMIGEGEDRKVSIGFFRAGEFSEEYVRRALLADSPN